MTRTLIIGLLFVTGMLGTAAPILKADTNFALEQSGVRLEVGAGLAFVLPIVHAEVRYHPVNPVSVSAFASAGYMTITGTFGSTSFSSGLAMANAGLESRAHLYLGNAWDIHAGIGASAMTILSESPAWIPIAYINTGVTFAPFRRIRIDAEVNPLVPLGPDSEFAFVPLPVLRVRVIL